MGHKQTIRRLKTEKNVNKQKEKPIEKKEVVVEEIEKIENTQLQVARFQEDEDLEPVKLEKEDNDGRTSNNDDEKKVIKTAVQQITEKKSRLTRPSKPHLSTTYSDIDNNIKNENATLKLELENLKDLLKKTKNEPQKKALEIAKWEAKKVWQNKVEQLKYKVQEKEKIIAVLEKQVTSSRDTIARLEKDKLRRQQGQTHTVPTAPTERQLLHKIEDLSKQLHLLGDENNNLRRTASLPRDKTVTDLEIRNKTIEDNLNALQKEMKTAGFRHERDDQLTEQLAERENVLLTRMLKLGSTNNELQFEVDLLKRDLPRLKERVEQQTEYINLLKVEKNEALKELERLKNDAELPVKKLPTTSGKSIPELEKTVQLLKNVVERVQKENEQLKHAPGVVLNQEIEGLKSENQTLKNRIHEITQQVGGQLSKRYESKVEAMDKLMKENEKLTKLLEKQNNVKERLRESKSSLQAQKDKLVKELEDTKKKLLEAEKKAPKMSGTSSRGYNSAVTTKMMETRVKKLELELSTKNVELSTLKQTLNEKVGSEREVLEDNERLREQVEILERFPPGAGGSDPNTIRELQLSRLTVARIENEKAELLHAIELLKRRLNDEEEPQSSSSKATQDEIKRKEGEVKAEAEKLRLETEVRVKNEACANLDAENAKLRAELANFNQDFFEELEDLKYNYSESVKKNILYERQLKQFAQQFGFEVDLPNTDDDE